MRIPNMLEIRNALQYGTKYGRKSENLLVDEGDRRNTEEYLKKNPEKVQQMRDLAEKYKNMPVKSLPYRFYRQFDTTGERDDYQDEYFEHRDRMSVMGMCAYLFGDKSYFEETEDIIWAICEEYTWCLPAHLGGRSLETIEGSDHAAGRDGKIISSPYHHKNTLDLFACETARELSELLHMIGKDLAVQVRDRAIQEIIHRVFEQYLTFNRIHHFEIDLSNWSAVCGGSIGVAALYLIDEEELLAPVIQRVISDLDVFLSSYGDDGIGREGVGYWNYGFSNFCYFSWLLMERTHNALNLFQDPKVRKVAQFPFHAFLFQDYCVNFSDCSNQEQCSRELFCLLKNVYPELPVPTSFSVSEHGGGSRYIPITLRKIAWEREVSAREFMERSEYFPDAGWMISCIQRGGDAISCVVKGGNNAEPHNQNDLGQLILMVGKEQFLCDLGSGVYTKDYFGKGRYSYLVNSSRGHSVPMIEGVCQREGAEAQAELRSVEQTTDADKISMELDSAYPVDSLRRFVREFCVRKKSGSITLKDTYEFDGPSLQVTERFVSLMQPEITSDGEVLICGQINSVRLFNQDNKIPQISKEEFIKHDLTTGTAWFVDYSAEFGQGNGEFSLQIEIL